MKHVLIPTDFSIKSLNVINGIAAKYGGESVKITLLHLMSMPASIADLLLFRRAKMRFEDKVSSEFYEACQVLQNKYTDQIHSLDVKIAYGETKAYLQNFIQANKIDKVIIAKDTVWQKPFKESVNMLPLLAKIKSDIEYMTPDAQKNYADMSVISMNSLKNMKQLKEKLSYVTEE